ncbi:hypothetical protein RR46_06505 [Papilio xuthus]|uniref:Uncharacterized protein n=1 Tax=Papilio xuthus TaxID=66420 RepID=A0A194QD52_PAPXU|nr:hypothetical protein RR46_06505 [Papilio xuthus]
MAKTAMVVTTCVVSVVILFVIFSYLLSIVNPGLMVNNDTYYRRMEDLEDFDDNFDTLYPNEELSAKDNVHFGLEKVPEDYEIFPYDAESKGNTEIGKRFAQKPGRISAVTVKSNIKFGDHILTTDGKKPVTLIVFPLKDNRRIARDKKNKNVDKDPTNVLFKIVDDSGQAKLEVIADSARLVYKHEVNNTKKELGIDSNIFEIRPNNTLLYNVKDQTFKIVNNKIPYINNNAIYNSIPRRKNVGEVMGKSLTTIQNTDKINSTKTVTKTTRKTYFLTTTVISSNLSVPIELSTVNDNVNSVSVMRKE